MPQFDTSTMASQVFWLVVTFVVLWIFLSKVVLPRIEGVIEARDSKISGDLKRAADARQEAEDAMAEYEAALAKARSEAQDLVRSGLEKLSEANAKRDAEFSVHLQARIAESEARVEAAREQALQSVRDIATDVTKATVERLTGVAADDSTVASALDASAKSEG